MSERTLQVNDGVGGAGFVAVPRHMLGKLSPNALALWVALLSHGWRDGRCYPGQGTLMAETQLGEHPLRKAKKELVEAGLLDETRRGQGKANLYRVRLQILPDDGSRNDDSSSLVANPSSPEVEEGEVEEDSLRSSSSSAVESTTEPSRPTSKPGESNVKSIPAGSCMSNDKRSMGERDALAAPGSSVLCDRLAERMRQRDPKAKTAERSTRWLEAADRLMRIDGRPFEEAMKVLEFSQADQFWQTVILSMPKFREKYGALRAKWLNTQVRSAAAAQPQATVAELMAAYERPRTRTGV